MGDRVLNFIKIEVGWYLFSKFIISSVGDYG